MNKQLMISIIDAAKKQLSLGNSELSLKLGHNRNYISRVLHQENPTIEQMTKVVDKVKELLPEFKHTPIDDAVMVSKDEYNKLKESNANLFNELSIRDFQINKFKKELNHKNQVLDKRNDLYRKLELECKEKDDAIKLQLENVASKILAINELELQLKTTQQKFVDVVDQKDSEIKKLQNDCNHATNQYQEKREQVVRLNEKVKKQASIYMIIIAILFIASIVGFAS